MESVKKQLLSTVKEITDSRIEYSKSILSSDADVKIVVTSMLSSDSFSSYIKKVLDRNRQTINEDIELISSLMFSPGQDVKTTIERIEEFRNRITRIRESNDKQDKSLSLDFRKAIQELDDSAFYSLLSFYPDDKIELHYKPEGARKQFEPLSAASAGQKAAAILTVILAQGDEPILLDQPEDDLDNRLVYELVVKQMKLRKDQKQIIVVTHNANIPVNGDAENIVSMNSQSRYVEVKCQGTMDSKDIRTEICDVMEGTEYAFGMRAKKYHLRIQ